MRSGRITLQDPPLSSPEPTPLKLPSQEQPRSGITASSSVLDVSVPAYTKGYASSAACECGAEKQIVEHVVLQCPIHRPPHGLHGLTALDHETIELLLNTCPEI